MAFIFIFLLYVRASETWRDIASEIVFVTWRNQNYEGRYNKEVPKYFKYTRTKTETDNHNRNFNTSTDQ